MNRRLTYWLLALLLICMLLAAGCGAGHGQSAPGKLSAAPLTVEVLDVGQGDAILIRSGGQNTLIDSGDVPARERLVSYIKARGISTIDAVVISHPHADHLGGMAAVLDNFTVRHIYDSGQTTTSALYRHYLTAVQNKKIPFTVVSPGMKIEIGGGAVLDILAPEQPFIIGSNSDINNNSIVAKLVFNHFSMLLPGDAEQDAEARLVKKYGAGLKTTVLKSGHHGSNTASSSDFLKLAAPEAVVISLGANNEYHHPHPSTLRKYEAAKLKIYRTDQDGTVAITSDGQSYQVVRERQP